MATSPSDCHLETGPSPTSSSSSSPPLLGSLDPSIVVVDSFIGLLTLPESVPVRPTTCTSILAAETLLAADTGALTSSSPPLLGSLDPSIVVVDSFTGLLTLPESVPVRPTTCTSILAAETLLAADTGALTSPTSDLVDAPDHEDRSSILRRQDSITFEIDRRMLPEPSALDSTLIPPGHLQSTATIIASTGTLSVLSPEVSKDRLDCFAHSTGVVTVDSSEALLQPTFDVATNTSDLGPLTPVDFILLTLIWDIQFYYIGR
jgi:hypothetical protein